MSFSAWHDEAPDGPTCGICGEALRLDRGPASAHRCPERLDRRQPETAGWLGAIVFTLVVLTVGVIVYALALAHNAEVAR